MNRYQLAQLNIAHLAAPLESEQLRDFVDNLDGINSLADNAPGFVWRLQTEEGDATGITAFGDEILVNMSVWEDVESLHRFVYQSGHAAVMRRRREWFQRLEDIYTVLWWVPAGHQPDVEEAKARLAQVRREGPTPEAFTFKRAFPPPSESPEAVRFDDTCLAD